MKKIVVRKNQAPIEIMSTMGCRTQNGSDINAADSYYKNIKSVIENNVLYDNVISAAQKDSRGNICPVTIILPTLAMECKVDLEKEGHSLDDNQILIDKFFEKLDQKINEAKDMLIERFDYICQQSPDSAKFMYENNTMSGYKPEEGIRSALKHGTLALGC